MNNIKAPDPPGGAQGRRAPQKPLLSSQRPVPTRSASLARIATMPIMIAAVVIAMGVMLLAATTVATFIERHPTTKMLALSFLLLVGVALVADGLGFHIPRGYLYFAIAFSLLVETLNSFARRSRTEGDPDT